MCGGLWYCLRGMVGTSSLRCGFFGFVLFLFQPLNSLKSKFPGQRVDRPLSSQTKNGGVTEGSSARLTAVTSTLTRVGQARPKEVNDSEKRHSKTERSGRSLKATISSKS